ncbi:MAG: DUF5317 family protein [Actinomycetota bacterium]
MIALIACAFALGLLGSVIARGRLAGLANLHLRWAWVLLLALLVSLIPLFWSAISGTGAARALLLASNVGVIAFLAVNVARARGGVRAGLLIAAIGWLLNFVVIAINAGMPLSRWAWEHSGQSGPIEAGKGGFFKVVEAHPGTTFRFLGDVIPLRVVTQVLSIGDILLLAGIVVVIAAAMRQHAREPVPAGA